ncbi:methionyl-tRNA synthetase [Ceratobasidium sp. 395]|nr:methionyl-tRNA synthetase [Ceratobasidium sp. 395]
MFTLRPNQNILLRHIFRSQLNHVIHKAHTRLVSTQNEPTSSWSLKPYLVTTPIFYPNADPHIGHLYSMVVADILARYSRLRHPLRRVAFSTGTDEHGLKIQQAAKENKMAPSDFCDMLSERFKVLASSGDISHTRFIRTTEPDHVLAVKRFWKRLVERGHVYKGTHSGWYSVPDECFYPESQVQEGKDPKTGQECMVSKETGQKVEWSEEENYKFRLSSFRQPLIDWLQQNPQAIYPEAYYRSVLDALINDESATRDLSVSRPYSRLEWGIRVPHDQEHTIYVWLDALINYLTVAGYPDNTTAWPADVSVIGKDIVRFHAIYWPAFLLALDLPPPKTLLTHGHWTKDRQKMSKSRGNVADPFVAMGVNPDGTRRERSVGAPGTSKGEIDVGVDGVRWYLLRAGGTFDSDSDWSHRQCRKHYNRELAGSLGNLLSRITAPKLLQRLPTPDSTPRPSINVKDVHPEDQALHRMLDALPGLVERYMSQFQIGRVPEAIVECLNEANRHITQLEPWLPRNSFEVTIRAHRYSVETMRIVGILLQPFMPGKAGELLTQLGVAYEDRGWDKTALWAGSPSIGRISPGNKQVFPRLKEYD